MGLGRQVVHCKLRNVAVNVKHTAFGVSPQNQETELARPRKPRKQYRRWCSDDAAATSVCRGRGTEYRVLPNERRSLRLVNTRS